MKRLAPLVPLAAFLAALGLPGAGRAAEARIDFNRDIRPILSASCFACHGADEGHRKAKLRLDVRAEAIKPRRKGLPALVPGKPAQSRMLERIEEGSMPPEETGNRLTPAQVALLRRWIEGGAPYAQHWSFVRPQRPKLPAVRKEEWPRNGIDRFVLARLEREGLRPSPEADRFALLRRVSLDLRGLPPALEEWEAFERDRSPDAYEKMVDRFLADPAHGERWARVWLDLARYADSAGYGSDPLRPNIWPYRDWVIRAFNDNMPYDRFTLEQLAGDLLPGAGLEQRVATAFHRNTMTNTEGGTDDEEFRVAAVKDRVNTTMLVWMGLTMGCAQCHSHKYDPLSHTDYYRFFAIFNQTADSDRGDEYPTLPTPTREQQEQNRRIDERIAALRETLEQASSELAAAQARWEQEVAREPRWQRLEVAQMRSEKGARLVRLDDGSIRAEGAAPARDTYILKARVPATKLTGLRLEVVPDRDLPAGGAGRAADGNFVLSRVQVSVAAEDPHKQTPQGRLVRVTLPGANRMLSLAEVEVYQGSENVARQGKAAQSSTDYGGNPERAIDGNTNGDYAAGSTTHTRVEADPWWEVRLPRTTGIDRLVLWNRTDGGLGSRLAGARVQVLDEKRAVLWETTLVEPPQPRRELSPSGEREVAFARALADFSQQGFPVEAVLKPAVDAGSGWAVAPWQQQPHRATLVLEKPLALPERAVVTVRLVQQYSKPGYTLGRFRLAVTADAALPGRAQVPAGVLALLEVPEARRSAAQRQEIAAYYRSIAPELAGVRREIQRLEKSRPQPVSLPVLVELATGNRRVTHRLNKGNFLDPAEPVEPGLPAAFAAKPAGAAVNRLDVARWIVHPDNPLTARVAVNRFWARLFGVGLVETEEDFGTQGEMPSHPELLDWLAVEYRDELHWDTKALLRRMVTSATYRQSARVSLEELSRDPRNRLLGRGPRRRLEAEMVRDQALFLAGLLSRKVGGPSVFPPQPPGLWQAAFNGERTWTTSMGADRHRRGLYTFWRRTIPYPSMAAFDAPSREVCAIKRAISNTPVQAFVTLNDPVYVEAARALARRIRAEGGASVEERVRLGLRLCLARPPRAGEVQRLEALYRSELAHYRTRPEEARQLAVDELHPLPAGVEADELAAWTVVANVLLNLDALLTTG